MLCSCRTQDIFREMLEVQSPPPPPLLRCVAQRASLHGDVEDGFFSDALRIHKQDKLGSSFLTVCVSSRYSVFCFPSLSFERFVDRLLSSSLR